MLGPEEAGETKASPQGTKHARCKPSLLLPTQSPSTRPASSGKPNSEQRPHVSGGGLDVIATEFPLKGDSSPLPLPSCLLSLPRPLPLSPRPCSFMIAAKMCGALTRCQSLCELSDGGSHSTL